MVKFDILAGLACTVIEVDTCRGLIGHEVDRLNSSAIFIKLWTEIGWKGICEKHVKPQGGREEKKKT